MQALGKDKTMRILLAILIFSFSMFSYGLDIYIDKGACPGEGCIYDQEWIAQQDIGLFESPNSSSKTITILTKSDAVKTITGEVHTIPGFFEVNRQHGEFTPGDEVLVYTYLGEGWFKIRHNGKEKTASLGFSPWGGGSGKRCEIERYCWGTLKDQLEFTWWVKVSTKTGLVGWTNEPTNFTESTYPQ